MSEQPTEKPNTSQAPKQPKKPKDDWKKAKQEKNLKKQQDREKERNKKAPTEAVKEEDKETVKQAPKESKQKKKQEVKDPKQVKPEPTSQVPPASKPKQPTAATKIKATTIEEILPIRKVQFRTRQEDVKSILLSYTPQLINEEDSTLLGSTHPIIREWSDMNIGQVVDIWGLTNKSNRKQNVIRTRFEDVAYFSKTITKMICGASAIFQNGAIMSTPGTLFLAVLAYEFNIPFIVLGSSHKYYDISVLEGDYSEYEGEIYDIIPAKYISLMVTEAGPINICSIETLFKQLHPPLR